MSKRYFYWREKSDFTNFHQYLTDFTSFNFLCMNLYSLLPKLNMIYQKFTTVNHKKFPFTRLLTSGKMLKFLTGKILPW